MNTDATGRFTGQFAPAHLAQWLETTRYYLFAELENAPTENTFTALRCSVCGWTRPKR